MPVHAATSCLCMQQHHACARSTLMRVGDRVTHVDTWHTHEGRGQGYWDASLAYTFCALDLTIALALTVALAVS